MGCKISQNINDRGMNSVERGILNKFGAKALISVTSTEFDADLVYTKIKRVANMKDFSARYDVTDNKFKKTAVYNYLYTGAKFSKSDLNAVGFGDLSNSKSIFPKGLNENDGDLINTVHKLFSNNRAVISATPGIRAGSVVISSKSMPEGLINIAGKDTLVIGKGTLEGMLNSSTSDGFINSEDGPRYNGLVSFLAESALHRGYDIVITAPIDPNVITGAVNRYNRSGQMSERASVSTDIPGVGSADIRSFTDMDQYMDELKNSASIYGKLPEHKVGATLDAFLSDDQKKTINKDLRITNGEKIQVAHAIFKGFRKLVPNVEYSLLTPFEIESVYGPHFANKKGFIMNGKIILNISEFTNETVFHEFGHFFAKWMKVSKPKIYATLMQAMTKSPMYNTVRKTYEATGTKFTLEEISEEVMVRQLGMNGKKEFESAVGTQTKYFLSEGEFDGAVDKFISEYTEKLVGMTEYKGNLDRHSNVQDIIDLQLSNLNGNTEHLFGDKNFMDSFSKFAYPKITVKEATRKLMQRGMIKQSRTKNQPNKSYITLHDENGSYMMPNGLHSRNSDNVGFVYVKTEQHPKLTDSEKKHNQKMVTSLAPYINRFKDSIDFMFEAAGNENIMEQEKSEGTIRDNIKGVELEEGGEKYVKDGTRMDRVSNIIAEVFSHPEDESKYIIKMMQSELRSEYAKKYNLEGLTDPAIRKDTEEKIAEDIYNFMKDPEVYKESDLYKHTEAIFKSKQDEGTFLHGVAELLFRTLNMVQDISYDTKYDKTYTYFMSEIIDAIANPDKNARREYFQKFIINKIAGTPFEGTAEYKDFLDILKLVESHTDSADSQRMTSYLLQLKTALNSHVFDVLDGPLRFMPEVRLASKSLGIAGTIDLLVLDRHGKAHVFDYKTKELGKERNWDFPSGIAMKGTMKGYQSNAMMKASVQTSLYKLMLREMGIESGPSKVLYVEGRISEQLKNENHDKRFVYDVVNISLAGLSDVTTELNEEFKDKLNISDTGFSNDLARFMSVASGRGDMDIKSDLEDRAESVYAAAVEEFDSKAPSNAGAFSAILNGATPFVVRVENTAHRMPNHIKSKEGRIDYIVDLMSNNVAATSQEQELERLFNTGDIQSKAVDKKDVLEALLKGANKDTHEFVKVSSMIDFGMASSGISMIRDKVTGETRILVLNHDQDEFLKFNNPEIEGDTRTVFGNFVSREFSKTFTNTEWKGTKHNMRLIKAGVMMMRMKKMDPSFKVSMVISNTETAKSDVPRLEDISTILEMTKGMVKVMQDSGETVPDSILELVNDDNVTFARNYINDPVKSLSDYISMSSESSKGFKEEHLFRSGKPKEYKDNLVKELKMYKEGELTADLFKAIHDFRNVLHRRLNSEEDKLNSALWESTDNVIMFLMDFNYNMSPSNPNIMDRFISTPSKASNVFQSSFNRKAMSTKASMNSEYMNWKNKFNSLLDAVAHDQGITLNDVSFSFSMKDVLSNLFKDPENSDRKTAFVLKSPSEVSSRAEKDMLKFLKETFQKYADETTFGEITIPDGWMPLITKSKLSVQSEENNPLKMARNLLFGAKKDTDLYGDEGTISDDMAYRTENPFEGQMPKGDLANAKNQFSYARRKKLGMDADGNDAFNADEKPLNMIEDNLENVMDTFVMASLETKHYRDITAFGRSLLFNVKRMEKLSGANFSGLISTLNVIQKRVINHETSESKSKWMSGLNNFTTQVAISGTVSQVMLETFTNPMVTLSNYFSDKLYGVMFSGDRQFSAASYNAAIKAVWHDTKKRKIIDKIDLMYGITSSDSSSVKEILNRLEDKSIFQSKHLMFFNKLMLDNWQKITMTAMLIEKGSLDAYEIDEFGNLQYDEEKDKKFHDYNATGEDRAYKKKAYEAVKRELGKVRGGLTGDRTMDIKDRKLNRGLTEYERNDMKELISQVYSSMDEESKGLAMYYTALGFMSKMKSWIFPKVPRYFQGKMTAEENASSRKLVKIEDANAEDGYRLEWRSSESEGILFTVQYLYKESRRVGYKAFTKEGNTLKEHQKKNVAMLLSDVGTWSIMSMGAFGLIALALDDEDKKNPAVQLAYKRFQAATGDVFLLYSMLDMTTGTGSMFVSLSVAARAAQAAFRTVIAGAGLMTGEEQSQDDFLAALNMLGRNTHGIYRSGEFGFDMVNHLSD